MIFGILKILILGSAMASTVFGLQVADTYVELKDEGKEIVWKDLLKSEFNEMYDKAVRLIRIDEYARGEIKKVALTEIERALRLYYLDYKKYPLTINELLKEYIIEDAKIIQDKSFYYRSIGVGYTIGVTLDSGEKYEVKKY